MSNTLPYRNIKPIYGDDNIVKKFNSTKNFSPKIDKNNMVG